MGGEIGTGLPPAALDGLHGRVGRVLAVGPVVGSDVLAREPGIGGGLRVGIACSRFNGALTWRLLEGALEALDECGVDRGDVSVAWAPGAFELPLVARALVGSGADAVVCLGAVVRGETGHYELVAGECAAGIQRVQLDTGVPVAFGVLTTEDTGQALARSAPGEANKGREAAAVAVEMARLLREV
ncbi:MAG: 6,7-dimethyl-8-ribityllumazine synthase [Actinomycetota bacterium]|jgi:6,7-dimethyl-8-ribityllumazine synthase|nr:6,7-dimethyl-8-ribityllumazine synthase [Actinomycetota bacterium]